MIGRYFSGTGNFRYVAEFFCNEYNETAKAFSIEGDNVIEVIKSDEKVLRSPLEKNKELVKKVEQSVIVKYL